MCNRKIFFLHNPEWRNSKSRGSAIMRVYVPSEYLKTKFGIESYSGERLNSNLLQEGDIVYFVKDGGHQDINLAKEKKCITVYDPIDDWRTFDNNGKFDFFVSCSESHSEWIQNSFKVSKEKCIVIDHLSTNVKDFTAQELDDSSLPTFGRVEPCSFSYSSKLEKKLQNEGSKFIWRDTSKIPHQFCSEVGNKFLFDYYKDIHVGLSIYDNPESSERLRYLCKPSTKLSAWSSYGIPAILTMQRSYEPYIQKYPILNEMITSSYEQTVEISQKLSRNRDFYLKIRVIMLQLRKDFHMNRCKELYVDQVVNRI